MIQVLQRSHRILSLFEQEPRTPRHLSDIARAVNITPSTCANIIKTLVGLGYLDQVSSRSGYVLGSAIGELTRKLPRQDSILSAARQPVYNLVNACGETIVLTSLMGMKRKEILRKTPGRPVAVHATDSDLENPYQSATGILLLAYTSPKLIKTWYRQEGPPPPGSVISSSPEKDFFSCLEIIRRKGFFMFRSTGNPEDAHFTVAYPVMKNGTCKAALGCLAPAFRFKGAHRTRTISLLEKTAYNIGDALSKQDKLVY